MNNTYRLIWNIAQQAWVVASEQAKGRKKSSGKILKRAMLAIVGLNTAGAFAAPAVNALPTGENVTSGSATFDRSVTNQLTVNQSSNKLISNWNSFDVGSNGKVIFAQPDAISVALNRVTGGSASEIFGQVTANGQLVIVNPGGITFGAGSQVSAASLIGSVLDIQNSDFNHGTYLFNRGSATGVIDNQGYLTAIAGSVALLAPSIKNSGSIKATAGYVGLVNANTVNLSDSVPTVTQVSSIVGLVSNSGSIQATQVSSVGGKIVLLGDTSQVASSVELTGKLNARESEINARQIKVAGVLEVDGAGHLLKLSSATPYSLSSGSKINLNGGSSGFSVNGTTYGVIRDINQLQAINTNLAGKYVLANDVDATDTASWNAGAGFLPVGNATTKFTGVLDGLGHTVSGLSINRPATDYVGLFGYARNSTIQNIGLMNNNITARDFVGGLVGRSDYSSGNYILGNNYATGDIKGRNNIGGLLGLVSTTNSIIIVCDSYFSGSVGGRDFVAGLLGSLSANNNSSITINNSYVTATFNFIPSGPQLTGNMGGLLGGSEAYSGSVVNINNTYVAGNVGASQMNSVGGLVGYSLALGATFTIGNSYAMGSVSGRVNIGGLVGVSSASDGGVSNINNSYATGGVSGTVGFVGGLVGVSNASDGGVSNINNSYATGGVSGTGTSVETGDAVGGLVGGTYIHSRGVSNINNSYATGGVSGIRKVGGLLGDNRVNDGGTSSISNSYATGEVGGTGDVGGLVGYNYVYSGGVSNINNSYWDIDTTAQSVAVGVNNGGVLNNLLGLTSSQMKNLSSFANWGSDIDAQGGTGSIWRIYEGQTAPLLRSFLTPVTATVANAAKTYDGSNTISSSHTLSDNVALLGSAAYASTSRNAGEHDLTLKGLYSAQQGYDLIVNAGRATINKADLVLTSTDVNKTYDGTTAASGSAVATSGTQIFGGDSISGGTFAFDSKHAGSSKHVQVAGVTVNDGNGGDNYNVSYMDNTGSAISKKLLTIQAVGDSKIYDGKLTSTSKPLVVGRQRGDSIAGLTQAFTDKHVGTAKMLHVNNYVVRDGNNGNNYEVVLLDDYSGVISPKVLTISAVANSKVYDGGITSANKPLVSGLVTGDRVTGLFQQYESKIVGINKRLIIKNSYVVNDGNSGNNYMIMTEDNSQGEITSF